MIAVRTPAAIHRTIDSPSPARASTQHSRLAATNDVRYPPPGLIEKTAHTGLRTSAAVIQQALCSPTNVDSARKPSTIPAANSPSAASFNATGPTPNGRKLIATAVASIGEKA